MPTDFSYTEEQNALVATAREFTRKEIIPVAGHYDESGEFPREIFKKAFDTGLMNIEVADANGGLGGSCLDNCLVQEEVAYGCAGINTSMAANMLGAMPILVAGNDEQKKKFLGRLTSELTFAAYCCSEPDAGSDVAAMRTRATRHGDDYVLNGQKIWTSHAHEADMMYTLVRTSAEGRKQAGISLLLVPLNTQGIEIRQIHTVDQWHHVNEVFLNNVRVPAKYLVGEEGEGWKCAKFLLDRERLSPSTVPRLARQLEQVSELLAQKMKASPGLPSIHALQERLFIAQASAKPGSRHASGRCWRA